MPSPAFYEHAETLFLVLFSFHPREPCISDDMKVNVQHVPTDLCSHKYVIIKEIIYNLKD